MKKYNVSKTTNYLIDIKATDGAQHTKNPNEKLIDRVEQAYFSLKKDYGINYAISTQELQQRTGCAPSTFNSNICGGVNGLLSLVERTVLLRFVEAVDKAEPDLNSKLHAGLMALIKVDPGSSYNAYKNTSFCMIRRTEFAVKIFPSSFWQMMLAPLVPAIDQYLYENNLRWRNLSETVKEQVYKLSADNLRYVVEQIVKEDFDSYGFLQTTRALDNYKALFIDLLTSNANVIIIMSRQ